MNTTHQNPNHWQTATFDTFRPITEGHGFTIDEVTRFYGDNILWRGTATCDCFIILRKLDADQLEIRIVKYDKKYATTNIETDADKVIRYTLFSGIVNQNDATAISIILKSTVGPL